MRPDLPTGRVTFLFTDVEGSTRLLRALGPDAYAAALADHRAIVRGALAAHGGIEVDTQGDAFFIAFPTAAEALAAAVAIRDELAGGPMQVRMGIHSGTPMLGEEGYVGTDVHLAARIASAGHAGQVLVSHASRELLDVDMLDLGDHRLKDFPDAVGIHQLGEQPFPPLRTVSNTNLPRPASRFVGRDGDVAAITERIRTGDRLMTLTGPGGSGKTRLALEVATGLVSEFRAGIFWIDLSPVRDAVLVEATVSETLGARTALTDHIGDREMLLLLDNFEQVIDAAPFVATLIERCPRLTILVTSRELLRVRGELEYALPPLPSTEAVQLFCLRSGLAPSQDITELSRQLDHLPLAIELAAARTSVLSPGQIIERLSQRLDVLKGGRDSAARQQTLRATIGWSYELLRKSEQELFARLAIFDGGCDLEGAEVVCNADLDDLQSLADKNLVRHLGERFVLLETIREFAAEQLRASGAWAAVATAHAQWMLTVGQRADLALEGSEQELWLDRLVVENNNIRAALRNALGFPDPKVGLELAGHTSTFWWIRGQWTEGRRWLEEALAHSGTQDPAARALALEGAAHLAARQLDFGPAKAHAAACLAIRQSQGDTRGCARVMRILGLIASGQNETEACRSLVNESARLARRAGDSWALSMALNNLGYLALQDRDWAHAAALLEEAIELARSRADRRSEAFFLENLGLARLESGDLGEARAVFQASAAAASRLGFVEVLVGDFAGLAAVAAADGQHVLAATLLGGADRINHEIGADFDWVETEIQARTRSRVDDALDAETKEAAYASGRAMSTDEVTRLVLPVR